MISLEGRKTLITGGSRGIGASTAILFAKAGSDVAITYASRKHAAQEIQNEVRSLKRECLTFQADFSQKKNLLEVVDSVLQTWGYIDVLVNNAGIWTYGEIGCMDEEVWKETIKVNLDSIFYRILLCLIKVFSNTLKSFTWFLCHN